MKERSLFAQAWIGIAAYMTLGLLLEGLLGWKSPRYLDDAVRRELFRLAHSHGVLLNLVLVAFAFTRERVSGADLASAERALRVGTVAMPIGFLLAGVWHPEGDPGLFIWIVPPAALLVIYGAVATALAHRAETPETSRRP